MPTTNHEPRVLIVEDDDDCRVLLHDAAGMAGATVAEARTAAEALQQVDAFGPDVLLIDIGLPGEDGFELARKLDQHPRRDGMSLVAVTGFTEQEIMKQAVMAGFDVFLVKPVDFKTVRSIVWNFSGRGRAVGA